MSSKKSRLRRLIKSRAKIKEVGIDRLCVFRSSKHIYAQIINVNAEIITSASTLEKTYKAQNKGSGNIEAASQIGKIIAEKALEKGVSSVAFDRSGFKYHGRVKALADAAREAGLKF